MFLEKKIEKESGVTSSAW